MESRVPWISEQTQGHLCKRAASMFFPFPSWWKKTPLTVETCPDPIGNSWHFRDLHTSDNKFSSLIRIGNGVWECWKVRHFYHRNKVKIARHRQRQPLLPARLSGHTRCHAAWLDGGRRSATVMLTARLRSWERLVYIYSMGSSSSAFLQCKIFSIAALTLPNSEKEWEKV